MKELLREMIYKSDLLFNFYFNHLYRPKDQISSFLDNLSRGSKGKLFFIQIGANDGQWGDPIYKFIRRDKWSGILIEPQRKIFDRLINNYKNFDGLFFENVAIDAQEGEKILYNISFTDSQWASGISSFIQNDIQKLIDAGYIERMSLEESISLPPNKKDWIGEEKVRATTLRNIFF